MSTFLAIKDPNSIVQWTIEWHKWLNGDTISTSTWTATGGESPVTLVENSSSIGAYTGQSPALPSSEATILLSGGSMGVRYKLTNRIVTAGGQSEDATIEVTMHQK